MAEIAILMAAYIETQDQLAWLMEAIASVQTQNFINWELCIVDDCSPIEFQSSMRLPVRSGPSAARNAAAKMVQSDWLLPLDADDKLRENALSALYKERCENEIVYGNLYVTGERSGHFDLPEYSLESLKGLTGPMPVTALHHRRVWAAVGGWTEGLDGLEDIDYWLKCAELGYCGRKISADILEYRWHSDSRTAGLTANNREKLKAARNVVRGRHAYLYQEGYVAKSCSKCPGSTGPGQAVTFGNTPFAGPDGVEMRYIGPRAGSFFEKNVQGANKEYMIEGKGFYFMAHPKDEEYFLSKRRAGLPEYEKVIRNVPTPYVPLRPLDGTTIQGAWVPIVNLNESDAIQAIYQLSDMTELRIHAATEATQATPRMGVLSAIQERINVLSKEPA